MKKIRTHVMAGQCFALSKNQQKKTKKQNIIQRNKEKYVVYKKKEIIFALHIFQLLSTYQKYLY